MDSRSIPIPFRRSAALTMAAPLKQYVKNTYDQNSDTFTCDYETIDRLRNDAIQATDAHISGIKKLQMYAAQLVWIGSKFPADVGIEFSWYPSLGYNNTRPISKDSLRFELINILYNLAALYSQLAYNSRGSPDMMKTACNYYCLSAGVIQHIQTTVLPELDTEPPSDLDAWTLECLQQLMLAQAQECVWQKAVKDSLKDATIAKVAAKVSGLFASAADSGAKSDAVWSEWIHLMKARHYHFAAAAQYRAACDCLEKRRYGEEIARLRDSLECVTEGLKESRYVNKAVLGDMNALKARVQEDLKHAEKDNDLIYLNTVPTKGELKPVDEVTMVAPKVPPEVADPLGKLKENGEFGYPLFAKLVPYAVHKAAQTYEERRSSYVNENVVAPLDRMTDRLHEFLESLGLPGSLQAIEKPLGLPPALVSHAEEIRQQDGPNRLQKAIKDTEKIKESDHKLYREGLDLLRVEKEEDERARRKHGTDRWSRPDSKAAEPKLHAKIDEIGGYLEHARSSDELILKKLADNEKLIRLLAGRTSDLEHFVPSSRRVNLSPALEQASIKLRACLNDVSKLESRRKRRVEALQGKMKQDNVRPQLLMEAARLEKEYPMQKITPDQFDNMFKQRLALFDVDKTTVTEEEEEQEKFEKRLREANASFSSARRGDTSTKQREAALQSLESAYLNYKQLISNLEAGRKFYNDLAKLLTSFRDECRGFSYQRRAEAAQIEGNITPDISTLNLSTAASLQMQKEAEARSKSTDKAPTQEPLAAPKATRAPSAAAGMWSPDMGIHFGGLAASSRGGGGGGEDEGEKGAKVRDGWSPSKGMNFSRKQ